MNTVALLGCAECGAQIAPGLLACPGCARLLHRVELARLAKDAEAAETRGDLTSALSAWRAALELLPANTVQRATIQKRMERLSAMIDGRVAKPAVAEAPTAGGKGKKGIAAGAGAAGLALLKSKALLAALAANGKLLLLGLLKLPTLISMLFYVRWSSGGGAAFGIGLVACIYVHEVGHVATLRRYGIEASAPMFVPGFGAFVRLKQYPTDAHEDARTGLAGPLWGLGAVVIAALLGKALGSETALRVASVAATINLFNLVPVWQLDGARGLRSLSRNERLMVAGVALAVGILLHQWMPAIVAAVVAARAFGKDAHPTGDRRAVTVFVVLVVAHALFATLPAMPAGTVVP
jgi:Zn-dependent protease